MIDSNRIFTKEQVETLLKDTIGKTLLQVDKAKLFEHHEGREKVKGIAGDIIEESVLGCKKDSKQEPDILVDGVLTEIKTTGMVKPKKKDSPYLFECKEPVSITAVSIPIIVSEEFESSSFWHKLAHMLWVYYWYNSPVPVTLEGYKDFPILGFHFYEFSAEDKLRLKEDWLIVRDFLIVIHREYPIQSDREKQYPRLSHELRSKLMLIDTAPKYPNNPRFRLKRSFATVIANNYFTGGNLMKLNQPITKYDDIDSKCEALNKEYGGKSFAEIAEKLGVVIGGAFSKAKRRVQDDDDHKKIPVKNFSELVVLKMFGCESGKLNNIEDFVKIGLIAKSLPLDYNDTPKESMKLFTPNFDEWIKEESFEDSYLYDYFSEHQLLLIVYKYTDRYRRDPESIKFVGFKRVIIPESFIQTGVKRFWEEVRSLIIEKRFKVEKKFRKDGTPILNPVSGNQSEKTNFPKEAGSDIFMRGSASLTRDEDKTLAINGFRMIPQEVWLSKRATYSLYLNQKS